MENMSSVQVKIQQVLVAVGQSHLIKDITLALFMA